MGFCWDSVLVAVGFLAFPNQTNMFFLKGSGLGKHLPRLWRNLVMESYLFHILGAAAEPQWFLVVLSLGMNLHLLIHSFVRLKQCVDKSHAHLASVITTTYARFTTDFKGARQLPMEKANRAAERMHNQVQQEQNQRQPSRNFTW